MAKYQRGRSKGEKRQPEQKNLQLIAVLEKAKAEYHIYVEPKTHGKGGTIWTRPVNHARYKDEFTDKDGYWNSGNLIRQVSIQIRERLKTGWRVREVMLEGLDKELPRLENEAAVFSSRQSEPKVDKDGKIKYPPNLASLNPAELAVLIKQELAKMAVANA